MTTQRVNIQYSIEIDKLPLEVGRLVKLSDAQLRSAKHLSVNKDGSVDITLKSVEKVTELRSLLAQVDHNLMDIENIMNGYIAFLSAPQEKAEPVATQEELYSDQELVDDLENKIENFKNSMQKINHHDKIPVEKHTSNQQVVRNNT